MNSDWISRKAKARAALESGRTSLPNADAVWKAVEVARSRMSAIVEDAREYRILSNEKMQTISDRGLRSSVGASTDAPISADTEASAPASHSRG